MRCDFRKLRQRDDASRRPDVNHAHALAAYIALMRASWFRVHALCHPKLIMGVAPTGNAIRLCVVRVMHVLCVRVCFGCRAYLVIRSNSNDFAIILNSKRDAASRVCRGFERHTYVIYIYYMYILQNASCVCMTRITIERWWWLHTELYRTA